MLLNLSEATLRGKVASLAELLGVGRRVGVGAAVACAPAATAAPANVCLRLHVRSVVWDLGGGQHQMTARPAPTHPPAQVIQEMAAVKPGVLIFSLDKVKARWGAANVMGSPVPKLA
jgi:hypothetical protein